MLGNRVIRPIFKRLKFYNPTLHQRRNAWTKEVTSNFFVVSSIDEVTNRLNSLPSNIAKSAKVSITNTDHHTAPGIIVYNPNIQTNPPVMPETIIGWKNKKFFGDIDKCTTSLVNFMNSHELNVDQLYYSQIGMYKSDEQTIGVSIWYFDTGEN